MTKKEFVEKELEKFIDENPYADTSEIAEHFLGLTFNGEETTTPKNPEPTDVDYYLKNKDELVYILSGALSGSPWFEVDWDENSPLISEPDQCIEDDCADILLGGGKINIHEMEEDDGEGNHEITLDDIRRGLEIVKDKYPHAWTSLVDEQADLWDYDAILQCAVFGELVYG